MVLLYKLAVGGGGFVIICYLDTEIYNTRRERVMGTAVSCKCSPGALQICIRGSLETSLFITFFSFLSWGGYTVKKNYMRALRECYCFSWTLALRGCLRALDDWKGFTGFRV